MGARPPFSHTGAGLIWEKGPGETELTFALKVLLPPSSDESTVKAKHRHTFTLSLIVLHEVTIDGVYHCFREEPAAKCRRKVITPKTI